MSRSFVACALFIGLGFVGAGCGPNKECQESCSSNDDCFAGLSCMDMVGKGKICIPSDCNSCTPAKPSCSFEVDHYTNGDVECSFTACQ